MQERQEKHQRPEMHQRPETPLRADALRAVA